MVDMKAVINVSEKDQPFLRRVMEMAQLPDIYDARDITIVVFRTMRDLMTTESANRVADGLHKEAIPTTNKALQDEVADLWKDKNPLVAFLSEIRPPLKIDSDLFIRRINQEAGLPRGVSAETAIKAVFSATKNELSSERSQEITNALPDKILQLWESA